MSFFFKYIIIKKDIIMNYYQKFKIKLEEASAYEVYIKEFLEKELGWFFIQYCENSDYDILMLDKNSNEMMIEVKSDKQSGTGNIIFEYRAFDKPSGISKTKSNIWVYVFPLLGELWFIKTKELKRVIQNYNPTLNESPDCYRIVAGGDGRQTRCYLWTRKTFKKIISKGLKIKKVGDLPE